MIMELLNSTLAFLSTNELLIIGIIILLLFGGAKIPQLMRGLGKGMGEFQRGVEEGKRTMEAAKAESSRGTDEDEKSA
jgi:sec-independent protein translocase protein TatA